MPTKPPHHVPSHESQNPHPSTEFWILTSGFSPDMQNEPKKIHRTPQACIHLYNPPVPPAGYPSLPTIKNAKRTQFTVPPPHLCHETNPISPTTASPTDQKMQNEPNLIPPNYAKRTQSAVLPPPQQPKNAKRTQFHLPSCLMPQLRETNPICPDRTPGPRRKNAKRTQFTPPPPSAAPIIRNEPNPSYRRPCRPPNMQNKPNLPSRQLHTATIASSKSCTPDRRYFAIA